MCHSERSEESLPNREIFVTVGIPRYARNEREDMLHASAAENTQWQVGATSVLSTSRTLLWQVGDTSAVSTSFTLE
jgi:hypothetical protein